MDASVADGDTRAGRQLSRATPDSLGKGQGDQPSEYLESHGFFWNRVQEVYGSVSRMRDLDSCKPLLTLLRAPGLIYFLYCKH